jgi:hypothetical protein
MTLFHICSTDRVARYRFLYPVFARFERSCKVRNVIVARQPQKRSKDRLDDRKT